MIANEVRTACGSGRLILRLHKKSLEDNLDQKYLSGWEGWLAPALLRADSLGIRERR